MNIKYIFGLFTALLISANAVAQSTEELAKAAQNPVASMISLPFQNNTNFGIGPDDETQNILNIQPVYPFELSDNWNFITRTIIPVVSQPSIFTGKGRKNGIGDTTFTGFFSPAKAGKLTWGAGPVVLLPTATSDSLGADKWAGGISGLVLAMPGKWVLGGLVSNVWSFAGSGQQDINLFTFQPFINYNMKGGWYLTTAPIITANWEADSDNKWTIPIGGGVGKIFRIGKQPLNGQVSAYKNVETPESGADWQLRLQLQLLFPK